MKPVTTITVALILGLAACAPSDETATNDRRARAAESVDSADADLDGTAWSLVTLDDRPAVSIGSDVDPRPAPGIEFVNGHGGGFSGCNAYGGPYIQARTTVRFGFVVANQMGCGGEVGEQEEALFDLLHGGVRVVRRGDALTLSGNGHIAEFAPGSECISCGTIDPVDRDLSGTYWRIRSVDQESTPAFWSDDSAASYVRFGPGTLAMTLGCKVYRGQYEQSPRALAIGGLASTEKSCADEADSLESRVAAILAADPRITFSHNHDAVVGGEAGAFVMELWPLPQEKLDR
jgi:heat shock protein HslJ